jgi:hypothetical protein
MAKKDIQNSIPFSCGVASLSIGGKTRLIQVAHEHALHDSAEINSQVYS